MKKRYLTFVRLGLVFLFLQGSGFLFANEPYVLVFDGSELTFSNEKNEINLGTQYKGTMVNIKIMNDSPDVLWIANVRGSCGLSVPSWPRSYIPPGEESQIQIRYDSSRLGPINRNITINANTLSSVMVLNIKGEILVRD